MFAQYIVFTSAVEHHVVTAISIGQEEKAVLSWHLEHVLSVK